jgi:hypothetical protein
MPGVIIRGEKDAYRVVPDDPIPELASSRKTGIMGVSA